MGKDKAKAKVRDRDRAMEDLIQENAIPLEVDIHQVSQAVIRQAVMDRDTLQVAVIPQLQEVGCHLQVDTLTGTHQMAIEVYIPVDTHQMAIEAYILADTPQIATEEGILVDIHLDIPIDIHQDLHKIDFLQQEMEGFHRTRIDYHQEIDTHQTKYIPIIPEILPFTEIAMIPATDTLMTDIPLGRVDAIDQITDTVTGMTIATPDHLLVQGVTTIFTIKMKETELADGSLDQIEDHPGQDLTTKECHHLMTVGIVDQFHQVQTVLSTITTLPYQEGPLIIHVAMREKPSNNWAPDRGSAKSSSEDSFLRVL